MFFSAPCTDQDFRERLLQDCDKATVLMLKKHCWSVVPSAMIWNEVKDSRLRIKDEGQQVDDP